MAASMAGRGMSVGRVEVLSSSLGDGVEVSMAGSSDSGMSGEGVAARTGLMTS